MLISNGKALSLILWTLAMGSLWLAGTGQVSQGLSYCTAMGALLVLPLGSNMGLKNLPVWKPQLDFFIVVFMCISFSSAFLLTLPLSAFILQKEAPLFIALSWKTQNPSLFGAALILVGVINALSMWWILGAVRPRLSPEEIEHNKNVAQALDKRRRLNGKVEGKAPQERIEPFM